MEDLRSTAPFTPRGTNLATLGFLMAAGGPMLLIVATLAYGLDTDDTAFFVIPTVLGLAGAALVRRRSTALKALCVLLAVLILMTVFWTAFGLSYVDSFFDFVPAILVAPGVLLAIGATVVSMRAAKAERGSGRNERRAAIALVAALGLLALVSGALTVTGRDTVPDDLAGEADLVVDMADFEFDQSTYDVAAGGTILVTNSDPFVHSFTVDALDIDVELGPADEVLITVPDETGTFILYCVPHTQDADDPAEHDMAAELVVA